MTVEHPTTTTFTLESRQQFKSFIKHLLTKHSNTASIAARCILQLIFNGKTKKSEIQNLMRLTEQNPTYATIAVALLTTLREYGLDYEVDEQADSNSITITMRDTPVVESEDDEDPSDVSPVETADNGLSEKAPDKPSAEQTAAPDGDDIVSKIQKDSSSVSDISMSKSEVSDGRHTNLGTNAPGLINDDKKITDTKNTDDGFTPVSNKDIKRGRSPVRRDGNATGPDGMYDMMTKALGRTLFYRHNDYIMGRVLPNYVQKLLNYQCFISNLKLKHYV